MLARFKILHSLNYQCYVDAGASDARCAQVALQVGRAPALLAGAGPALQIGVVVARLALGRRGAAAVHHHGQALLLDFESIVERVVIGQDNLFLLKLY